MGEMVTMLVLWLVVIGVMWFLLMRPQKKNRNVSSRCWLLWRSETQL